MEISNDNETECDKKINAIRDVISSGCDERLFLDLVTGRNKYHLDPMHLKKTFYRGSCTAGILTPFTWGIAESAIDRIQQGYDENRWAEEQRERLSDLICGQKSTPFNVFFGPSGSDLVYYPLLFQHMCSERPILNIVSCPEELGSGSNLAAEGRYHAYNGPFGSELEKGGRLSASLKPKVVKLDARTFNGKIRNRAEGIKNLIKDHPDHSCIVNLVYGSKSGIEDDLAIIDPNLDVMWTVDLCQFRADPVLINDLLEKGVMVLITGSKFYNAPPFCGALLVPDLWKNIIREGNGERFECANDIFAKSDIPNDVQNIREVLTRGGNKGSRLRWDCALAEMEAYNNLPKELSYSLIQLWNEKIVDWLNASVFFELIPDQHLTNPSIVSFRVYRDQTYFSHDELKRLFSVFVNRHFSGSEQFERVFIGQPVQYGDSSFIRFALGSWAVRELLKQGDPDWSSDRKMIDAFEQEIIVFDRGC